MKFVTQCPLKTIVIAVVAVLFSPCVAFSQKTINQLVSKLSTAPDSSKVEIYHDIYLYYKYFKPDSAHFYLIDGIKKFTANDYKPGVASLTNWLGMVDANHGNLLIARKRLLEALKLYTELNDKKGIGLVLNGLGTIECRKGNWDSATMHFIQAQKVFQEIGYEQGLGDTYTNLGLINQNTRNFEKSLAYYNKALDIALKYPDKIRIICNVYNNIATVYGEQGNLVKAVDYLQLALKKSDKEEFIDIYMYSLLNLGIIYSKFANNEKALTYLNEALSIAKEKNMPEDYANIVINIAPITGITDPGKAIRQLEEALQVVQPLGNKELIKSIYSGLADLNKKTGNYKAVVTLMEQIKKYDDSTASVEKVKEIANLQSVYELEQSTEKIKELYLTEQTSALKRNILYTISAGLVALVIIILLYLYKTKQLNAKLARHEAQLEASNSVKDRLFSIIGHDLRGPMGNITMILDMLDDEDTPAEERREILHSLSRQSRSTLTTLDNLLVWGRSQIKEAGAKPDVFLPAEYLQKNLDLLEIAAKHKKLSITNDTDGAIKVYGDPLQFDFVIRNLISNSIKFTRANGSIQISSDKQKIPGFVVYSVKDSGIGMKEEELAKIFTPFTTQARGTAGEKGTGIGLTLSKEFVNDAGGHIWVESEAGKGTTFYFTIKAA